MAERFDAEVRDALAQLSRTGDVERARAAVTARARAARHRRTGAALVLASALVAAGIGTAVVRMPGGRLDRVDVQVRTTTTTPTTAQIVAESPVPPPHGAAFPVRQTSDTSVLRHSGGPYISRAQVGASVLSHLGCAIGTPRVLMPGFVCARVDVAFFDRYADAWQLRGASWVFVSAWAPDREMYVVTVWGRLVQPTPPGAGPPALTEITTVEIDATTGRTMMEGGPPLPPADANR